ncbi:hypothetical protein BDN71DRAFT_835412 [Pleurotus eryngii]|uniref:Uncharacterized protein n=1 Tax=Pleurotus eryngii TaxID=5323 RepID=A0A9P6A736_PLEER|nr:hypothetical protein BDN71DRAFT_835412 [Pleurotus eryngii]
MRRLLESPLRRLGHKTRSPLCSICSKLDLHHILRHGILVRTSHTTGRGTTKGQTLRAVRAHQDGFSAVLVVGQTSCGCGPGRCGSGAVCRAQGDLIVLRPPERELCHRLIISPSDKPQVVYDILSAARSISVLHIQLMQEDARVFKRRPDVHGRRVVDVVAIDLVKKWLNFCVTHHHAVCHGRPLRGGRGWNEYFGL